MLESEQVVEMKDGNNIAPYNFKRVSIVKRKTSQMTYNEKMYHK